MIHPRRPRPRVRETVLLSAALALQGCIFDESTSSFHEVARVPAPGGRVDAVLAETNGGATTAMGYRVYVVPPGRAVSRESPGAVATLYGASRSERASGANLQWAGPGDLAVEFESARHDSVLRPSVRVAGLPVRVALRRGVTDSGAPQGAMSIYRQRPAR